jgi:hypothetical protein
MSRLEVWYMAHKKGRSYFMVIRASMVLCTVMSLFVGGVTLAQQAGTTSGPAAGTNVESTTATQKSYESEQQRLERGAVGGIGGGRPGVEAMPGTQGGAEGRPGK